MNVWVEDAFLENFLLDGALLYLSMKTARLPVKKIRLALAAALGAAFALVCPLLPLGGWLSFFLRFFFGGALCLAAADRKTGKTQFLLILFFYLYTFAYGGLLLGVHGFFSGRYDGGQYALSQAPVGLVALLFPVFAALALGGVNRLKNHLKRKELLYDCAVSYNGQTVAATGLLDTGNGLEYGGLPVCLLDGALAARLGVTAQENEEKIFVRTATGGGFLPLVRADLKIYSEAGENIIENVYFAVGNAPFGGRYGVILSPNIGKEGGYVQRTLTTHKKSLGKIFGRRK